MRVLQPIILITIIFFLGASNSRAQTSLDKNIQHIRNVFTQINSQTNLQQIIIENEELIDEVPDGGISLTGFFKNKKILKIEQWVGLSYGIHQIEFYFDNDSLIFVYVKEQHFRPSDDSIDHSKIDLKFEGRYYFKNDTLIHQTTKGIGFWSESNDGVSSLLPDSKNYQKFLYSKKNNDG
jgi:hypothetical protein